MTEQRLDVLLVEDNPADAAAIGRQLDNGEPAGEVRLRACGTLALGIEAARAAPPDVVLLDLNLPDSGGLDTVRAFAAACPELPVVVLTGLDDEATGLAAVNAGAEDYLVKGQVDAARLARILRFSIERHRSLSAFRGLSTVDDLTGVHNRRGFLTLAARHFAGARPLPPSCALFFADVDGLKMINDLHGHAAGDLAIEGAADALRRAFRPSDLIGRLGGDEFAVLRVGHGLGPPEAAVDRVREEVEAFNAREPRPWKLSLSVGFSRLSGEAQTLEDMIVEADRRMYASKGEKRRR